MGHKPTEIQSCANSTASFSGCTVGSVHWRGLSHGGETEHPQGGGSVVARCAGSPGSVMAGPIGLHGQHGGPGTFCRLQMRPLQLHHLAFFCPISRQYNTLVPVTTAIIPRLQWWAQWQNLSQGVRFPPSPQEVTLTMGASLLGWGAYIGEASVSGQWLPPWDAFPIN